MVHSSELARERAQQRAVVAVGPRPARALARLRVALAPVRAVDLAQIALLADAVAAQCAPSRRRQPRLSPFRAGGRRTGELARQQLERAEDALALRLRREMVVTITFPFTRSK